MTDKYSATVADFFECSRLVELVNAAKVARIAENAAWDPVWAGSAESVEQADEQVVVATRASHARAAAEKTAEAELYRVIYFGTGSAIKAASAPELARS
jgi:hypothetical protein